MKHDGSKRGDERPAITPHLSARAEVADTSPAPVLAEFVKALARDLARADVREQLTRKDERPAMTDPASKTTSGRKLHRADPGENC